MNDLILQPTELDLEALILLPDDAWPLDERRVWLDLAAARAEAEGEAVATMAREEALDAAAQKLLDYRDTVRRADALERERSGRNDTRKRVSLRELYRGQKVKPTVGRFIENESSNGGGLFYAGKVNEIHGPSESGKTMIVLAVVAQEIRDGNSVAMYDMEDSGEGIVERLVDVFGLTLDQVDDRFWYFNPEVPFDDDMLDDLSKIPDLTLCVIDAVTEGMSMIGLDGRNENDVATWYNSFPKRIAGIGPAVVVIDHTSNDRPDKAIGSQHKKSGISGVSYTAEPVRPFVVGGKGHLRLAIAKDRPGGVRSDSLPRDDRQHHRGDFKIDGTGNPSNPKVELWGVDPALLNPQRQPKAQERSVAPPPAGLAPVLMTLADDGEWMSSKVIGGTTGWEPDRARTYANRLVKCTPALAEKKVSGTTVYWRVTPDGLHAANAWVNQAREDGQQELG